MQCQRRQKYDILRPVACVRNGALNVVNSTRHQNAENMTAPLPHNLPYVMAYIQRTIKNARLRKFWLEKAINKLNTTIVRPTKLAKPNACQTSGENE